MALVATASLVSGKLLAQGRGAPTVESPPATRHAEGQRAASAPPEGDVSVRTSLDRTAMFVGDRVVYTIEVTCRRGHDVLADDLSRDKLRLEGLEVVGNDTARHAEGDVTRYEFRYVLTTYRVDTPVLKIAPFNARYYVARAGQKSTTRRRPGRSRCRAVSSRSAACCPTIKRPILPATNGRCSDRAARFRVLQPVGLGLILLSIAPVALLALAGLRRARQRRQTSTRRSLRQARQASRASLEAVRAADPASAEDRRDAFARLDALVRQHLSDVCGVPAASLTPLEIAAALSARPSGAPVELASSVLSTCELALYAPPAPATFSVGLAGHARTRRTGPRRRPLSEMRFLHHRPDVVAGSGASRRMAAALACASPPRHREHCAVGVRACASRRRRFAVCPPACCSSA